jgi:hypothetical protein
LGFFADSRLLHAEFSIAGKQRSTTTTASICPRDGLDTSCPSHIPLGALAAMSAAPTTRAVLRHSRHLLRRNNFRQASTTSEAASKAQETGKQAVSKASEGLSRVQSSASSAVSRVGSSAYTALSRVGGRTGRMISFVECMLQTSTSYTPYRKLTPW